MLVADSVCVTVAEAVRVVVSVALFVSVDVNVGVTVTAGVTVGVNDIVSEPDREYVVDSVTVAVVEYVLAGVMDVDFVIVAEAVAVAVGVGEDDADVLVVAEVVVLVVMVAEAVVVAVMVAVAVTVAVVLTDMVGVSEGAGDASKMPRLGLPLKKVRSVCAVRVLVETQFWADTQFVMKYSPDPALVANVPCTGPNAETTSEEERELAFTVAEMMQ